MIQKTLTYVCDACGDVMQTAHEGEIELEQRIFLGAMPDVCGRCAVLMLNHLCGRIEGFRIEEAFTYAKRLGRERTN